MQIKKENLLFERGKKYGKKEKKMEEKMKLLKKNMEETEVD